MACLAHQRSTKTVPLPCCGQIAPKLVSIVTSGGEDLIGPAVVDMLSDNVGLVGSLVLTSSSEARLQSLKVLKPMAPLSLTVVRHELPPAIRRDTLL